MKDKKLPLVSLLSTILIGGYTIVLLCVGIVTIFLGRYAGGLITAGMNLTANSVGNGDYISGYLMLPGFLSALLGGMTGTVAFLLAAGMFLLFLLFLILLISSIVMLKKKENKSGRLCENNYFLYSFDSFLAAASKCTDNPAADNSSNYGTDRVDKEKRN